MSERCLQLCTHASSQSDSMPWTIDSDRAVVDTPGPLPLDVSIIVGPHKSSLSQVRVNLRIKH